MGHPWEFLHGIIFVDFMEYFVISYYDLFYIYSMNVFTNFYLLARIN